MTDFEIFALNHKKHNHCQGCGRRGAVVDAEPKRRWWAPWSAQELIQ